MLYGNSVNYFIGTDGEYEGAIFDDQGNGVDQTDWENDIPSQPLQTLIIDENSLHTDEYGCTWALSDSDLLEMFVLSEDDDEFEAIRNGYREVFFDDGFPARDKSGRLLYVCEV